MSVLEGKISPKDFAQFLEEVLPNFTDHQLHNDQSFLETIKELHTESFCNEAFAFKPDHPLTDDTLHEYLHTLMISAKRSAPRIEKLYG